MAALVSMFLVLIYIDAEIQILPDVITIPGIVIGVAASFISVYVPDLVLADDWTDALIGAALGALLLTFVILAYWLVRRYRRKSGAA